MNSAKRLSWVVLWVLLAMAAPGWPSETRLDSTGGLTTIMTDETTDLSFFMEGNPAGLLLLNTHSRLDEAFQWGQENSLPVAPGSYQQTLSTEPRLAPSDDIHYSGWMAFPSTGWAFQAAGDFLSQTGLPQGAADSNSLAQYRGLIRAATNLGPVVFGLEIRNMEADRTYDKGLFSNITLPYSLQSGTSALNQTFLRVGLAKSFPENRGLNDSYWQAGGTFETQLAGGKNALNLNLTYPGGGPFTLGQNTAYTDYYFFGPELRYEVPHKAILLFTYYFIYDDTQFDQTVSQNSADYPNMVSSAYHSSRFQSMDATGSFRLSFSLSGEENLKLGGFLSGIFNNTDLLDSSQNVTGKISPQKIVGSIGVGLEAIHNYTLGFQFQGQSCNQADPAFSLAPAISDASNAPSDATYYEFTLGGERWLDDNLAFRLGLTAEDLQYPTQSNQNLLAVLNMGMGWEDTNWACDGRIWVGEQTNLQDSTNQAILDGFEISGTLFL